MELLNYDSSQILKTEVGWCEPVNFSFDKEGKISSRGSINKVILEQALEVHENNFKSQN